MAKRSFQRTSRPQPTSCTTINVATNCMTKKTSSNCVTESPPCLSKKPMPTMPTTRIVTSADQGAIKPTPMMPEKAKMQLHADSMTEHTNGKTVLTTGKARTATMTDKKFNTFSRPLLSRFQHKQKNSRRSQKHGESIHQWTPNGPLQHRL